MPYVKRDTQGRIISLHKSPQEAAELLPDQHPEVQQFLGDPGAADTRQALARSDQELARVTEDLIHLLINKNLILFTDLPAPVQDKLLTREKLRSQLQQAEDNFLDDSELL